MLAKKRLAAFSILAIFLSSIFLSVPLQAKADLGTSITYLQAHAGNPWVTMALAAAGQSPSVEYLKNATRTSATDYETAILALAAAGKNPRTFLTEDLIAKLEGFIKENQIGEATLLNDDIFGVLAFTTAGVSASDSRVSDSVQFIISHQLANGGWGFSTSASSDTNTTAAAVMALRAAGKSTSDVAISKAVAYLKSTQNTDGGYPYDPAQSYSAVSDSSSDAWVISALYSVGENPSLTHLQSLMDPTGFAHYVSTDDTATGFTPVATAYAVIALSGKYFPVNGQAAPTASPAPILALAKYTIQGSTGVLCAGTVNAATAIDVVKNASQACGYQYEIVDSSYGPYLKQIGGDAPSGSTGWMYAVNGQMPNIGAADYKLSDNDLVTWFFGPFDMAIPGTVDGQNIALSATIATPPVQPQDSVGFEIDVNSLAFGSLKPGSVGSAKISARNTGSQPLKLYGYVSGDALFKNYLQLAGTLWRQYSLTLASGQANTINATLPIPADYSSSGNKQGSLIFWAITAN